MYTFRIYKNGKHVDSYFTFRPFDIKKVCEAITQKVINANIPDCALSVVDECGANWTPAILHEIREIEKDDIYIPSWEEVEI